MRLLGNITGFEMPMYTTHALKRVRLQTNNTGFEMPICVTHALKCVRLQVKGLYTLWCETIEESLDFLKII